MTRNCMVNLKKYVLNNKINYAKNKTKTYLVEKKAELDWLD